MFLRNLVLRDFRNYEELNLCFRKNVNLIIGNNAQGKTNLLEAIYCLCTSKSHRTNRYEEMIRSDQPGFHIKGEFESDGVFFSLELISLTDGKKRARLSGKPIDRLSDLVGMAKAVIFSPESLLIVKGAPSERRRFLDILISQIDRVYLHNLQSYLNVLKQRNELLKQVRDGRSKRELIDVWDEQLLQYACDITARRRDVVEKLSPIAADVHDEISGGEKLEFVYQVNGDQVSDVDIGQYLETSLAESRERDIIRGSTSVGPHRDDIVILLNGADSRRFCSQGQQRTISLSLKISEFSMIREQTGKTPIMLMDDVASELDPQRGAFLYRSLDRFDAQVFLTTTHVEKDYHIGDFDLFIVTRGTVECMR